MTILAPGPAITARNRSRYNARDPPMTPVGMRRGVAFFAWLSVSLSAATPLQDPLPAREHLLVVEARKMRQPHAHAPLELTLASGKRITVPPQDVHAPATTLVRRAMAGQAYRAVEPSRLFVLHIRELAPVKKSDVKVTLSSGGVVHVRSSDITDPRLTFLRTVLEEAHWASVTERARSAREASERLAPVGAEPPGRAGAPPGVETQCNTMKGDTLNGDIANAYFQPWLKKFSAQVRRSWFIPAAAMSKKGQVRLRFVVHRDGRITDLTVYEASSVAEFNQSALAAVTRANPTEPLPPEFLSPHLALCVTFYFNETPGG